LYWTFGERTLKPKVCNSKSELKQFLSQCGGGSILLGEGAEFQREFYAVTAALDCDGQEPFGIGICSEGHGLGPHVLLQPDDSLVWFGFNSEAVAIDLARRKIAFSLPLDSLFHRFVPLKNAGTVLIFHEIGLVSVSEKGKELWRYSNDIITKCQIKGNEIALEFMDSSAVFLEISTGRLKVR
jgi:hypothetical protein